MNKTTSFYWFDYETFGTHPAWDRPCQFAGVRTDADLNVIGEPLVIYCRQSPDYLPNPEACRITGISPQLANAKGLCEAQFIRLIHEQMTYPGTCSVGYNNIRFDDEFTRHTLFRNLFDAYEQEWKNDCSRWDLLDIVRLTRALRPDGIQWPTNENGLSSNRLEHLSVANGIEHSQAHDAMSDVWATLGMAKLIKQMQPRLFNYAFNQRGKQ
ncbi:MAG: exodeoxyribonuclease-1, partial [bacterium]